MALRSDYRLAIAPDWLPDDTEESVLGTEWHQESVHILANMLRDVAYKRGLPWGVYEQVELRGCGVKTVSGTLCIRMFSWWPRRSIRPATSGP